MRGISSREVRGNGESHRRNRRSSGGSMHGELAPRSAELVTTLGYEAPRRMTGKGVVDAVGPRGVSYAVSWRRFGGSSQHAWVRGRAQGNGECSCRPLAGFHMSSAGASSGGSCQHARCITEVRGNGEASTKSAPTRVPHDVSSGGPQGDGKGIVALGGLREVSAASAGASSGGSGQHDGGSGERRSVLSKLAPLRGVRHERQRRGSRQGPG